MTKRILGALAALLLASAPCLAGGSAIAPPSAQTAVSGGACPSGQAANGIAANTGAPTGCLTPSFPFVYRSGIWWFGMRSGGTPVTLTASTLACGPVEYWTQIIPTKFGAGLFTASGTFFSVFLYANNPTTDRPTGTPLLSALGLDATTVAPPLKFASVSGVTLQPLTKYWECAWADTTPKISGSGISSNMFQLYGDNTGIGEQQNATFGLIGYSTTTPGTYTSTGAPDLTSATWSAVTANAVPATRFQN